MAIELSKWLRLGATRLGATNREAPKEQKKSSPYRAVLIVPGVRGSCNKARELAGKPFLANEAPTLPLPGCDAGTCNCRFNRRDDRREGPRRAADDGLTTTFVFDNERRTRKRGRRKNDLL